MSAENTLLEAAKVMGAEGVRILLENQELKEDLGKCLKVLAEDPDPKKPSGDYELMLAGAALGVALMESTKMVEALGGFDKLKGLLGIDGDDGKGLQDFLGGKK